MIKTRYMKVRIKCIITIIISIILICINYNVKAQVTASGAQNSYGKYFTDGTYEYMAGTNFIMSNNYYDPYFYYNPPHSTSLGYSDSISQVITDSNLRDRSTQIRNTDRRGWQFDHNEWFTYAGENKYAINNGGFDEYIDDNHYISKYDYVIEGVQDGGSSTAYWSGSMYNRYRRTVFMVYRRPLPSVSQDTAYINSIDLSGNYNTYSSGSTLWIPANKQMTMRTVSAVLRNSAEGQNSQYSENVVSNYIFARSSDSSIWLELYTDARNGDNQWAWYNSHSTGWQYLNSVSVFKHYEYGNAIYWNGLYQNGLGSEATYSFPDNKDITWKFDAADKYGTRQSAYYTTFWYNSNPYTTLSTDGTPPGLPSIGSSISNTWTNNNVSVGLNAHGADTRSGTAYSQYRIDGGSWNTYTGWFTVSTGGWHNVDFRSIDNVGNIGNYATVSFGIDKTLPNGVFTPNSQTWTNNNINVSFNSSDLGDSGVKQWRYRTSLDNGTSWGAWSNYILGSTSGNIILSTQAQSKIQAEVTDNAGNINTVTSGTYQIDKTIPNGIFTPNNSSASILSLIVSFDPSDLGGSGVKQWRYKTSIDNGTTWGAWSSYTLGDTVGSITLNTVAQCKLQVEVTDNAGNINTLTSGTYNIVNPIPTSNSLTMYEYNYKQDNNNYWIKPNSTIGVYTDGYFPSSYGIYPTRTYVLLAKDGVMNISTSARQCADINGSYTYGSEYSTYFNMLNSAEKAQQFISNGNNYIGIRHHLTAKLDGTKYKMFYTTTYINGSEYYSGYIDSGIWLNVDGTAPTGNVNYNYNPDTAQMNINVSNIIEAGSGVNKIWAEYSSIDNPTNIITKNLSYVNGIYQDSENLYSMFSGNADTVNIKIKALDNVGNQSTLSDTNNDVFMVKALIARVLTPNDNNFKSGEKGVLKISVYGGVDTLKITFPTELSSLDGTLNKTLTLTPKVSDSVNYEFFVPLEAPSKAYNVEVKAFKNGKEKDIYPSFTVNGTILNEIRTRLRVRS